MNVDRKILEFLKLNLYKAHLESFGIKRQFIELVFCNSRFEEIKFFLDCRVSTPNPEIKRLVSVLKELDKYTFAIVLFSSENK